MKFHQWHNDRVLSLLLPDMNNFSGGEGAPVAVAIMFNASDVALNFSLPVMGQKGCWNMIFHSAEMTNESPGSNTWDLASRSIACVVYAVGDTGAFFA